MHTSICSSSSLIYISGRSFQLCSSLQENSEILSQRAVVYVNLDEAISGQYSFAAEGSAILAKAVSQAMKEVNQFEIKTILLHSPSKSLPHLLLRYVAIKVV